MDYEKLIERLYKHHTDWGEGRTQDFFEVCLDCKDAATALSTIPALQAELEQVKQDRDVAVKDIELIVRRINDCNIKLDDGTTVSSLELGRCRVCKHEETGDCDDGGCIFEWRGPKKEN